MFKQRWELAKKWYRIKSRPSLFSSPCWLSDSSSEQRESVQTRRAETKEAKHVLSHAPSARFSRCLSTFRFCLNCCYCFGRAAFKQKTTAAARRLLAGTRVHFFTPSFVSAFLASANWKLRKTNTTSADDVRRCRRTYLNIGITPNSHPHGGDGIQATPCIQRNSLEVQLSPRLQIKTRLSMRCQNEWIIAHS